ncbi:MAG: DUF5011 domain-containing protein, partial [Bacteroidia bacterium]
VVDTTATADFASPKEAADQISQCGIAGAIVIDIKPGTYKGAVEFSNVVGLDATNTISFTGDTKDNTILENNGNVLALDGADYITFEDLTFKNTTNDKFTVWYGNQADHNVMRNCDIEMLNPNSYTYTSCALSLTGLSNNYRSYGNNANYNTFENINITGGYTGANIIGNTQLSATPENVGNKFYNVDISDFFYYGMYTYTQDSMDMVDCKVVGPTSRFSYPLYHYYPVNMEMNSNYVKGGYNYLYYVDGYNWTTVLRSRLGRRSRIVNNSFELEYRGFQNRNYGRLYVYYCDSVEISHNALRCYESTYNCAYIYGCDGLTLTNNVFYWTENQNYSWRPGAIFSGYSTFVEFDYNNIYADIVYNNNGTEIQTLAAMQNQPAAGLNLNNYNEDPKWVSTSDYHYTSASPQFYGTRSSVETDMDGDQRCVMAPTVGPDEIPTVQLPPRANFVSDDTLWLGSPAALLNANQPSRTVMSSWYLNGQFVTDSIHMVYTPSNVGLDTVTLVMENCSGSDTVTKYVYVSPILRAPKAEFAATTTDVYTGEVIGLIDLTENGATQWAWDVTNSKGEKAVYDPFLLVYSRTHWFAGDDSTKANPSIWFDYPGTYTVKYKVANSFGADSITKTAFIKVREQVMMCDIPDVTSGEVGTLFDDGGAAASYSPGLNGFNRCTYTIESCVGELMLDISEFDLAAGDYLKIYDGNNSGGTPLWDEARYPDGMTGTRSNASVVKSMIAKTGAAYFEFSSDNDAATLGEGFAINWEYSTPANWPVSPVSAIVAPDTACVGFPTVFESASTGSISDQEWDLDADGTIDAFGDEFSYTFTTAGTYTVKLITNSLCAPRDSMTKTIVIEGAKKAPTPDFTSSATKLNTGDTLMLESSADYCSNATEWIISPANYILLNGGTTANDDIELIFTRGGFYDISVVKSNPFGSDTLTRTAHVQVLDYCTPNVILKDGDIGISRVVFNTIDNSTSTGVNPYNNYLSISTTVERGYTYDLTMERATNDKSMNRKAWIDWNIDGDFDDTLEMVAYHAGDTTKSATFSVTVPANATGGKARLRVGVADGDADNTACGPNKFGEFEDYTINIMEEDMTAPTLTLVGPTVETIEVHTSWVDSGFTAIDLVDGDVASSVVVNSSLDTAEVGIYTVEYKVSDASGNTATATRTIEVIDSTDPIIELGGMDTVYVQIFTSYTEAGTTESDNYDATLTPEVTSNLDTATLGTYTINYCVTDQNGNGPVCVDRTVIVIDTIAPIITLDGNESETVEVFSFYNDAGYTVVENDGYTVETTGNWDGTADSLGTFTITYTVTDNYGNQSSVTRTIEVVDTQAPVISLVGSALENVARWAEHTDEGVAVEDNYDAQVDIDVAVVNGVNTQSEGVYTIEYTATDKSGNSSATLTRVVIVTQDMTTGIDGIENNGFAIYPNPSAGLFFVATSLDNGASAQLRILDLTGKEVYNAGNYVVSNSKFDVDMSHLATGTYYLEITNNDVRTIEKVVITK